MISLQYLGRPLKQALLGLSISALLFAGLLTLPGRSLYAWAASSAALLTQRPNSVMQVPPVPSGPDRFVDDLADVLSDTQRDSLVQGLYTLDQRGQAQICLLILPYTDRELSEFAPVIFNQWHIGHKERDDGVLILVNAGQIKTRKNSNRIFVSVGTGIQGILPDGRVGRLLDAYAVPTMDRGDAATAAYQTTVALAQVVSQEPAKAASSTVRGGLPGWVQLLILLALLWMMRKGRFVYLGGLGGFGGWGGGGNDYGGGFGGGDSDGGGTGR